MAGPLLGMIGQAVGAMLASQVGSGLGALAGEVLTASDIGLPLGPAGKAALVPTNVAAFAEGLDVGDDDVLLYLALREAAHQRLFAHVPWLREHLIGAVTRLRPRHRDQHRAADRGAAARARPDQPGVDAGGRSRAGCSTCQQSPAQQAALSRLEVTLALVEGWVDEVVGQATAERMPAAAKLQEAVRRRRAAGGPAEQTFASLVGLELRPRRLRDASTLWGSLRTRQGAEARDGVWMHPDLLPTAADLDDPLGFREDAAAPDELSEEDFDAGLRRPARRQARATRPSPPTRGRVTLHARRARGAGRLVPAAAAGRRALRDRYVDHLRAHAGRHDPRLLPRPPDRQHARAVRRRRPGAAHPARARRGGGSSSAGTASRVTPRCWPRPHARGDRGVRDRRPAARPGAGPARASTPSPFCDPRGDGPPPRRPVRRGRARRRRATRSATSRSTCAGGRSTPCPTRGRPASSSSRLARGRRRLSRPQSSSVGARRRLELGRGRPAGAGSPWPARRAGSGPPRPRTARRGRPRAGARARAPARSRPPTWASPWSRAESRMDRSPGVHEPQRERWLSTQRTDLRDAPARRGSRR